MPLIQRFEDLEAWQRARALARRLYQVTEPGSFGRDWALIDQIRRAALSIMNNIVEGFDSGSPLEFIKFLRYAHRSGAEVQSCLYLALDQGYCSQTIFDELYKDVERTRALIAGLIRYLRQSSSRANVNTSARQHVSTSP